MDGTGSDARPLDSPCFPDGLAKKTNIWSVPERENNFINGPCANVFFPLVDLTEEYRT